MIRLAEQDDLEDVLKIYEYARSYMASVGNPNQWGTTNPPKETLEEDIRKKQLYVCVEREKVYGVFAWILGDDPTYAVIEEGSWKTDTRYGTIHRIASDGTHHGVFRQCVDFCKEACNHIRIDTHADNYTMQHCIETYGFERCGIIYVRDHSPRIAYEYLEEQFI